MSEARELSEQDKRLNQMWDWGHNCKIAGFTEAEATYTLNYNMQRRYSSHLRDRFWEGYNAPKTRDRCVRIDI